MKLIALDLDGTLLNRRKEISPRNLRALDLAAARGAEIVPASGRSRLGMPAPVTALPYVRHLITCNGASLVEKDSGRELWSAAIPKELALDVLETLRASDGYVDFYADGIGYVEEGDLPLLEERWFSPKQADYVRATRRPTPSLRAALSAARGVHLMQIFFPDPAEKPARLAALRARYPQLSIVTSLPNNIELNWGGATKGAAMLALCALLGIDPRETVAFGDEQNDIPMLRDAGLGIAMGNAGETVRAAADRVTASNEEDGVARALEPLLSI